MSYNTRRSTGFGTPQQQSAASVGQRRPVVTNNFVPGGQLSGNQPPQKPQGPAQQQRPQGQPQQSGANFRSQNQQPNQQQSYQTQSYSTQSQQQQPQGQPQVKQEPRTPQQQQPKPAVPPQSAPQSTPQTAPPQTVSPQTAPPQTAPAQSAPPQIAPVVPGAANPPPSENDSESMDTTGEGFPKKRFWNKNRGKITKAEKVRRRNLKLSKILQPKNAVMILNELVKGCIYNVDEVSGRIDNNQFRASVVFEGHEFPGTGRTKNLAKNAAAECALKHLVKNKQLSIKKEDDVEGEGEGDGDVDEKMEIPEEDGTTVMPWSHIASFAMFKLFSSWGEDPVLGSRTQELLGITPRGVTTPTGQRPDPKPAKKMPDNPESMNPLMLMNQMVPTAVWEEVGKSGLPPNVIFTFKATVGEEEYTGNGSSKKAAKKQAAYAACHKILKVDYPPEVWAPLY